MNWTDKDINAVWQKGTPVAGNDPNQWRHDPCKAWMSRQAYGNRDSQYGWEIDHINPNGGDGLANLQPLHWANNAAKSDGRLVCAVTSSGVSNINTGK